jgi:hypothetical protein
MLLYAESVMFCTSHFTLFIYGSYIYICIYKYIYSFVVFLQVLVKRLRFQFLYCSRSIRLTMSARLWSLLQPGSWLSRYLKTLIPTFLTALSHIFLFVASFTVVCYCVIFFSLWQVLQLAATVLGRRRLCSNTFGSVGCLVWACGGAWWPGP